jgi:hypothetical protein
MTEDILYRPTPEFRDYLEHEVVAEFRRVGSLRWLRVAAAILVCVAIGTTGGLASAQMRDAARRDSLLDAKNADAAIVAMRLDLARARLADLSSKARAGAVSAESVGAAEAELRRLEAEAFRVHLDIEEIRRASQPSRDDLNAPLVDGKDYVLERIRVDLDLAQRRLAAAEQSHLAVEKQVQVGAASDIARIESALAVARARGDLVVAAERQTLRREFLERGTPGDLLVLRQQRAQLRQDLIIAHQALALARERAALLKRQASVGAIEQIEALKAEVDARVRELEVVQLGSRLQAIDRAIGARRPGPE